MSPKRLRGVVRYRKLLVYSGQVVTEVTRLICVPGVFVQGHGIEVMVSCDVILVLVQLVH